MKKQKSVDTSLPKESFPKLIRDTNKTWNFRGKLRGIVNGKPAVLKHLDIET